MSARVASPSQAGRTRATVVVLLGLGIALLGALLVPRLLNEARTPEARQAQASICFALLDGPTLEHGGTGRVAATRLGRRPLQVAATQAAGASAADIATSAADALRGAATGAGWPAPLAVAATSNCLHLENVVSVGGDPGMAGLGVAYALAARSTDGGSIRVDLARSGAGDRGPIGSVALSAHRAASAAGGSPGIDPIEIPLRASDSPEAALLRLGERLGEAGWTYQVLDGGLEVRGLPDGSPVGGLMLSVQYDEMPAGPAAELTWTLSLAR